MRHIDPSSTILHLQVAVPYCTCAAIAVPVQEPVQCGLERTALSFLPLLMLLLA